MADFIDRPSQAPYMADDTREWIEHHRTNGKIKPQCLLRFATDTNYIHNQRKTLYAHNSRAYGTPREDAETKCMMNLALPGMRVPGLLNWEVNETQDSVVQTASFEALNALPVSQITTTLTDDLAGVLYGKSGKDDDVTVTATWALDSLGVTRQVTGPGTGRPGNANIEIYFDDDGYRYREGNVKYRTFQNQVMSVYDTSDFPDPRIPDDDDNDVPDDEAWPDSATGQGSFFVLIGREVIRVMGYADLSGDVASGVTNRFLVAPGGRAINGILETHSKGDTVHLLGYGPYTNTWCGMGYLNLDDYAPQTSIFRPGTCFTSYEGYGDIVGPLSHDFSQTRNYQFTGYWFITGVEPSLTDDGVPRIKVSLKGTGYMLDKQKTTPDLVRRIKNQFDQWHIGETTGVAAITAYQGGANIGWVIVDKPGGFKVGQDITFGNNATPHQISAIDTNKLTFTPTVTSSSNIIRSGVIVRNGLTIWGAAGHSRDIPGDWVDYSGWDPSLPGSFPLKIQTELAQHKAFFNHMTETQNGTQCEICVKEKADWTRTHKHTAQTVWQENRAVGKHIYKESIRVYNPIKTYIRLMATIAAASWDHPALGTELAQRFTKLPHKLFDNIRNVDAGLIFNGQLVYDSQIGGDKKFDWANATYDDTKVIGYRDKIVCPFDVSYDTAPFWQPMQDLAELNGCVISITRQGYPSFVPRLFAQRPFGSNQKSSWNLTYGGSISGYSPSTDTDSIITQCWVRAAGAIDDSSLQVITGGTGWNGNTRVIYSGLGGNREGLMFTAGVQQTDQFEIPNVVLGLDWDTMTRAGGGNGWGARFVDKDGNTVIQVGPPFYQGGDPIGRSTKGRPEAKKQVQRTINFFIQRQILAPYKVGDQWVVTGVNANGNFGDQTEEGVKSLERFVGMSATGIWTRTLHLKLQAFLDKHIQFLKFDPMWYINQPFGWVAYLSAVTGAPLVVTTKANILPVDGTDYVPDQKATQNAVAAWTQGFAKQAINIGSRRVDEAIDKATARSITSNLADPRIMIGDVIWAEVPGFISARNAREKLLPPFKNGIYVTQIGRQMDLLAGTYTATYQGYRYRADFQQKINVKSIEAGWQ